MIARDIEEHLISLSKKFPIVTITGPRQSGKTTLARKCFPKKPYINLENIKQRNLAKDDPEQFLSQYAHGLILDEIQHVPELCSYIQVIVDERKRNGMYILTGSQNFSLSHSVSQSLAGRTALFRLLPLSFHEIQNSKFFKDFKPKTAKPNTQIKMGAEKLNVDKLIYYGFYPRIYQEDIEPKHYYPSYIETYLERDIRELQEIKNLSEFQKFLQLCAGRIGQIVNFNSISSDLGVSAVTVKAWLNLLQASYIVFLLYPYHAKVSKRLVKSPKLYFCDVGLAANLIGIENSGHVKTHPLKGNLFENLAVMEVLKYRYNRGLKENINFYRDNSEKEVDIIYANAQSLIPIEVKSSETMHNEFFIGVNYFEKLLPKFVKNKTVLYAGDDNYKQKDTWIENLESLNKFLGTITSQL